MLLQAKQLFWLATQLVLFKYAPHAMGPAGIVAVVVPGEGVDGAIVLMLL
jgi:hypothetical protein